MPIQTGAGNGARAKGTGSHEEGWEQEFMHRQESQRCQGMSLLLAEVEEQKAQEDQLRTSFSITSE